MASLRNSPFRWRFLPYCLRKMGDHGHVWLPLNRHYKPLGGARDVFVDYNDFLHQALVFSRDPNTFKDVREPDQRADDKRWLYLYLDGTDLERDYFPRLHRLLSHKHTLWDTKSGQNFLMDGRQ